MPLSHLTVLAALASLAAASPAPLPRAEAAPLVTPAPTLEGQPTRTLERRVDVWGAFESGVNSVMSGLGSSIPSYVASGVPNFFQDFPTGDKVQSSLGIDDDQVYKQPNTSVEKLNKLANVFLIGTDIKDLPPQEQDQARNITASIFILQQGDQNVTMIVNATGGTQNMNLPTRTTAQGDFDEFVPMIQLNGLQRGDMAQNNVQRLNIYANGSTLGNATAYLVPPRGYSIISDIDDILRVTKIYKPKEGLLNSFARAFVPWQNMPAIYANWAQNIPGAHFHYLTTTPEQATRIYMDYIYKTYPAGSFDTRPLNFSDVSATLSIRKHLLDRIFETFPERRFVLVADTSNSDIMKAYPQMVKDFPGQVACILLRNTSATDPDMLFPYNTAGFKDVNQSNYMFFRTTDDLVGLDLGRGDCYNSSVPQNLTFGYQAELLKWGAAGRLGLPRGMPVVIAAMVVIFLLF
ncbi:hypothetical protein RB597_008433 [Gaeumannomyces tritici]